MRQGRRAARKSDPKLTEAQSFARFTRRPSRIAILSRAVKRERTEQYASSAPSPGTCRCYGHPKPAVCASRMMICWASVKTKSIFVRVGPIPLIQQMAALRPGKASSLGDKLLK